MIYAVASVYEKYVGGSGVDPDLVSALQAAAKD